MCLFLIMFIKSGEIITNMQRKIIAGKKYSIHDTPIGKLMTRSSKGGANASIQITGPHSHGKPNAIIAAGFEERDQAHRLAEKIGKQRQKEGLPTTIIVRDLQKEKPSPLVGPGGTYSKNLKNIKGFKWSKPGKFSPKIKKKKPPGQK